MTCLLKGEDIKLSSLLLKYVQRAEAAHHHPCCPASLQPTHAHMLSHSTKQIHVPLCPCMRADPLSHWDAEALPSKTVWAVAPNPCPVPQPFCMLLEEIVCSATGLIGCAVRQIHPFSSTLPTFTLQPLLLPSQGITVTLCFSLAGRHVHQRSSSCQKISV